MQTRLLSRIEMPWERSLRLRSIRSDSRTLIVASVKDGKAAVFLSRDAGGTWEKQHDLTGDPAKAMDRSELQQERSGYLCCREGRRVGSCAWRMERPSAPKGVTFTDVSAGFSKTTGAMIYATSEAGVFLSSDGGSSWTASPLPGVGAQVRAIATSLNHPESAYVSYSHLQLDGETWMGVARTQDSGRTLVTGVERR